MSGRVLIAGIGNELLGDDGFGIAVAQRCAAMNLGPDVRIVEAGIAGIGLVQDLMDRYDTIIILDALDGDEVPGSVRVLEIVVPKLAEMDDDDRRRLLTDMHYTVPSRVMILAQALGVLPRQTYMVGCQPLTIELGIGLSAPVAAGVDVAVAHVRDLVSHASASVASTAGSA